MNVRKKILGGLMTIAVGLLIVGILMIGYLFSIDRQLRNLGDEVTRSILPSKGARMAEAYYSAIVSYLLFPDQKARAAVESADTDFTTVVDRMRNHPDGEGADPATPYVAFIQQADSFKEAADAFCRNALSDPARAAQDKTGLDALGQSVKRMDSVVGEHAAQGAVSERRQGLLREISYWVVGFSLAALAGVVYSVMMAVHLTRTFCSPLEKLTEVTQRVADGDLTVAIDAPKGNDEVARLARSFQEMLVSQREVVSRLKDAVSSLTNSTREINDATTQQSATGSEQAGAVAETTATVDQVNEAFGRTSQMIQSVTDLSARAVDVSHAGQTAVDDNVNGMREVNEKMESIADNIMALSEKTQLIGEIISTVNDISEQSKFLALNASIEAARAGEHGRGFAVVAMEVRNLAEQSKQATTQIRDILIDIQNATNSAVMVTEEGSRRVQYGMELANQTGTAIQELAEAVTESAQAAERIAASVREQTIGMSQITTAMNQINQAAAHNLAGTKQVETAARDLRAEGNQLKEVVDRYNVNGQ